MNNLPSSSRQTTNRATSGVSKERSRKKAEVESLSLSPAVNVEDLIENLKDNQQLLSTFSEELWAVVMDQVKVKALKDSSLLEHLSNSSPFFRNRLLSERTQFLFPKVLDILDTKYHRKQTTDNINFEFDYDCYTYSYLGYVYKKCRNCEVWNAGWWYSALLKFRQVCKSWDTAVDQFLGHIPSKYTASNDPEDRKICRTRFDLELVDYNPRGQKPFLKHFKMTHLQETERSPFATKTVRLALSNGGHSPPSYLPKEFIELLTKYGRHIWNCELYIGDYSLPKCYHKLQKVLELMPNLKFLDVRYDGVVPSAPADLQELQPVIPLHPLPKLESLQVLKTTWIPCPIWNELIRNSDHVAVLDAGDGFVREDHAIDTTPLPNLKQFLTRLFFESDFIKLENLQKQWSLKKVSLDFKDYKNEVEGFIQWSRVFRVLEKWADTLTSLELTLPYAKEKADRDRIVRESSSLKLNLPHVVNLKLEIDNLTTMDFIMPMKDSLEFLEIKMEYHENKKLKEKVVRELESGQVIKFLNCYERPLETNIWAVFEKLKRIQFEEIMPKKTLKERKREGRYDINEAVYTRNEWKKQMKK